MCKIAQLAELTALKIMNFNRIYWYILCLLMLPNHAICIEHCMTSKCSHGIYVLKQYFLLKMSKI